MSGPPISRVQIYRLDCKGIPPEPGQVDLSHADDSDGCGGADADTGGERIRVYVNRAVVSRPNRPVFRLGVKASVFIGRGEGPNFLTWVDNPPPLRRLVATFAATRICVVVHHGHTDRRSVVILEMHSHRCTPSFCDSFFEIASATEIFEISPAWRGGRALWGACGGFWIAP